MYSAFTLILLISAAFSQSWSQGYNGHYGYQYYYEDYAFLNLIRSVMDADMLVQGSCTHHNYRTTVTSGDGYYILKYYLDNIVEDSVVIKIYQQVIFVTATLGNDTVYKNLKILPDHVLVDGALWKVIDGHLNVIMGSSLWSGREVNRTCGNANRSIISVPKAPLSPEDL